MLSLAAVTALIVLAAFAIQTAARLGIAKTLRFGSPRHARAPYPPPQLATYFGELEEQARELGLEIEGIYYVDDGDGRGTVALYARDEEGRVWARLEPTGSVQLPTRVTFLSLREDETVRATVFPHPDPLLPEPEGPQTTETFFQSPEHALRAHRRAIASEDVAPTELRDLLTRCAELREQTFAAWRRRGWLDGEGKLTFAGVLRAGERLQRYAGASVDVPVAAETDAETGPQKDAEAGPEEADRPADEAAPPSEEAREEE